MRLANREARRFNQEYVGTEHILVGLVKEREGVAASVLQEFGINLRKIRLEIEKIVQHGPAGEQISSGRRPCTPRAKKVVEYAVDEARNLGHNWIGTEHLLLGLIREAEGVAAQVLMNLGVGPERVRAEVIHHMTASPKKVIPPVLTHEQVRMIEDLIRQLSDKREQYVAEQDFEQADRYRDAVGSLRLLLTRLS